MKKEKVQRTTRLVGSERLAKYIDTTPASIRQRIHNGTLPFPYSKQGRKLVFDLDKVDAWIDGLPEYGMVPVPEI